MSHPVGAALRHRIELEFVEADVEIGFSLVDMAERELGSGNPAFASRALHEAEEVFNDIRRRLECVGDREREPFGPLVEELRREIDSAKPRT